MGERLEITEKKLGLNRDLVTPIDELRAAEFAVGTVISGGIVSNALDILSGGGRLRDVATSNQVRIRPLNLEVFNQEGGWLELEFRDGFTTGSRVLGPYYIQARSGIKRNRDELIGRYFTSGIFVQVLSGWAAQPLSTGVKVNISFVEEPLDRYGL